MALPTPRPHDSRKAVPTKKSGRPFASNGEVTRRQILAAAQVCFAAHGFRETSNRLVADLANITSGTIYHYFANKRDLFLAAHEEIQISIMQRVDAALASGGSFYEIIDKLLNALMELYIEHPNWIRFNAVVRTEARRNPEILAAQSDRAWRRMFSKLAAAGVASGEIDPANKRAMQTILSATILGLTQHGIEASSANHIECYRGFSLLLRGLLVKPQAVKIGVKRRP